MRSKLIIEKQIKAIEKESKLQTRKTQPINKVKPNCEKHKVPEYLCDLKLVATDLADMPYDKLSEFFEHFTEKMAFDANNDFDGERFQVAEYLTHAEIYSEKMKFVFEKLWKICEPYMKEKYVEITLPPYENIDDDGNYIGKDPQFLK